MLDPFTIKILKSIFNDWLLLVLPLYEPGGYNEEDPEDDLKTPTIESVLSFGKASPTYRLSGD